MSFDSLILRSVVSQLHETVIDGEVLDVIQSSPFDVTIRISASREVYNLLFSIHPVYARIHLTKTKPKREKRWHFADFLQTHIGKAIITDIEQIDLDRIIRIRFVPQDDVIAPTPKALLGEFMGKHSNVILLDEVTNRILESIKHIDEDISRYRQILPGETYIMPPVSQIVDPFSADDETITAIMESGNKPLWRKLLENFQGMSPLFAKEIAVRAGHNPSPESIKDILLEFAEIIQNSRYSPNIVIDEQGKMIAVSAINLRQFPDSESIRFPTINEALEYYYDHIIARDSLIAEKASILQAIKKKHADLEGKQEHLRKQLKLAEDAESLKMKGEILLSNLYKIHRGQPEVTLPNFYDPNGAEITIELDEKLSPANNAQRYFDEYKKAKKSKTILEKLIKKNLSELQYMEMAIKEIDEIDDLDSLTDKRDELVKKGLVKEKTAKGKKPKEEVQLFRRFLSSDGFQIYVGRNDKENDLLVKGESSKDDMWLHAKQIEGSHVLIKNPERRPDIPRRTLLEAAVIAASFSKAKHSGIVPVDYTWVKYVSKPRGAKPGFVIYRNEKTLFVSPSDFDSMFQRSGEQE